MDNTYILNLLQPFFNAIRNNAISSASMYAFKTLPITNDSNPLSSLKYEFFDTSMKKDNVITAVDNILKIFNNKYLSKESTVFEEYAINNSKKVIDYINLTDLDFSIPTIQNGTEVNLDSDNYKIQFFLNSMISNCCTATSKKDYAKFKHSALKLTTNNNETIIIVNKVAPIYKPKNWLYIFDPEDIENEMFKLIDKKLFRLPLYPHIIIVNNICLLIEPNVESIFGFEKFNKKLCKTTLETLETKLPIQEESFNLLSSFSNKGRNYNLFCNFNQSRLTNIENKDANTYSFIKNKLNINVDSNGDIVLSDNTDAQKLLLYLCNCIFEDPDDGDKLVEAKNSKPL